jgi:hypothetical protein
MSFGRGLLVGAVSARLDRVADLAAQRFDRVGVGGGLAQVGGQRQERRDVITDGAPGGGDHRVRAPRVVEALELFERGVAVDGGVDRSASVSRWRRPRG